jgi:iron complex transport system ATP-binding protein
VIALRDVGVTRGRRHLLDGIDLELRPGEVLAIAGPNGAGKSTIVRLLGRELAPDRGHLTLDGRRFAEIPAQELARRRAILPQSSPLGFPFKVLDVVLLGRTAHGLRGAVDRRRAEEALAAVGLTALRDRTYTTLSGGERQRTHLARVLVQLDADGGYLVLDEPTASQDIGHAHAILALARALARRGVGVIAILHDLALAARYADRIAVLAGGRLLADGTPRAVLTPPTIARAFSIDVALARSLLSAPAAFEELP